MSVTAIIELDDDDAEYLAKMAKDGGLGFGNLCASIIALVVMDDRALEASNQDTAA